ncbi:MAG: GGDEF domain-containing protein [Thiohalomonadaceae bacterium]
MQHPHTPRHPTDALTGLYTWREFERLLCASSARVDRYGGALGLVVFELDKFSELAHRLGPEHCDELLKRLADMLARHVRASDVLAHWKGGRFAVLAPELDLHETTGFAVKLRRLVAEYRHNGSGLISASFGVTEYHIGESLDLFTDRALGALAHAQANGGNRVAAARAEQD